jgi:glucose/arabinose dehydrogenase
MYDFAANMNCWALCNSDGRQRMVRSILNSVFSGCVLAVWLLASRGYAQTKFYVSDLGDGTIEAVSSTGGVTPFVTGLTKPLGLAMDNSGNLYVAEHDADFDILKITPDGNYTVFASMPGLTEGLAFDKNGNLYAGVNTSSTTVGPGAIIKIAPDGSTRIFASASNLAPEGIAFNSAGNLFVDSDSADEINEITPDGNITPFNTKVDEPVGLAINGSGNLYATNNEEINLPLSRTAFTYPLYTILPNGSSSFVGMGSNFIFGLTIDGNGNLFGGDLTTNSIVEISTSGQLTTFATGLDEPAYILSVPEPKSATVVGTLAILVASQRLRRGAKISPG